MGALLLLLLLLVLLSPLQQLGINGAVLVPQQRDDTHQSTLRRNVDNTDYISTSTLQDSEIQESGQAHTLKLNKDESTIPATSIMQFPREVINSHQEELLKLPENVHFHHKTGRIKHNIHYDEHSSEDAKSIFSGEKKQNKSANYKSGETNFKISSDYDADDEDVNVEEEKFVERERNCRKVLCDLLNTNCENSKGKDLSTLMESLYSDRANKFARNTKPTGKNLYPSKEKLGKIIGSENAQNNVIPRDRHKRASFIIPQLAVVIPMMDHEEDGDEDVSRKLKRCIKKQCHTGLCHKMGCYEDSVLEPTTDESYESENNSPFHPKKLFSQSNDPTFNHNINTNAYSEGNILPLQKIAPWQRAENKPKKYTHRTKFHEIPHHVKERKHEARALLHKQLSGQLNDDDDDNDDSSESSADKHLNDCAERLKNWINVHWENKRNPMKYIHLDTFKQVRPFKHQQQEKGRAIFHEQLEKPTNFQLSQQNATNERYNGNSLQPRNEMNFDKINENDYLLLPKENEVRVTSNILHLNKSIIGNENKGLPAPYKTITSHYSEKQQKQPNIGKIKDDNDDNNMTNFNSTNNMRNSHLNSLYHTNTSDLHYILPDNLKSQPTASEYLLKELPKERVLSTKETKPYSSARSDSESFEKRFVPSAEDDELLYPVQVIKKSPTSNTPTHSQHLGQAVKTVKKLTPMEENKPIGTWQHQGQTPIQLLQKEHYNQHSGILQQVNLQEIYKNLPHDFELSAGQWIHLKPLERNKNAQSGINIHPITEKPKKQYNKGMQDLSGSKYRNTLDESQKLSENIPKEFTKISEIPITTTLPNEINPITNGFSKRTTGYKSENNIKLTPPEKRRKPTNIEDNKKYINASTYLPQERNIPTNLENDNPIMTTEQYTGTQLLSTNKNYSKPKNPSNNAITNILPKEFNTIVENFQDRFTGVPDEKDDYKPGSHVENTPSEEKRNSERKIDSRKNIGTNVYIPERRITPTQLKDDNLITTREQSIGEYLPTVSTVNKIYPASMAKNASQYVLEEILSSLKTPNTNSLSVIPNTIKNEENKFNYNLSSTYQPKTHEIKKTPPPIHSGTKGRNIDTNQLSNREFFTHLLNDERRYKSELPNNKDYPISNSKNEDKSSSYSPELQYRESNEDDLNKPTPLFNNQNISNTIRGSKPKHHINEEDELSTSNKNQEMGGIDFSKSKYEMNLEDNVNIDKMNPVHNYPYLTTTERSSLTSHLILNNARSSDQNVAETKKTHEQHSDNSANYEFSKVTSATKTNPDQGTSENDTLDDVSSALKTSDLEPNIQETTVYYGTDRTFKNMSDERLDYSQNKKFSNLRSSSSETIDDGSLQKTKSKEEGERGDGRDNLQPYTEPTVYPQDDATITPPFQEGVSGKQITQQNGFEEKTYLLTAPEERSLTHNIWAKEERVIPFTSYPTDQGSSKPEISNTKSVETPGSVETMSHITGRFSMTSTEIATKKNHDQIPLAENVFEEKESKSSNFQTHIDNLQSTTYQEPISTKESTSEYSGTLYIVDPITGGVTEAIPVIGRVLSGRSKEGEEINELYQDSAPSSYQPYTFPYLETHSPIKYSEAQPTNMAQTEDNLQTLAQDIPKSSQFSIEIFDPTPRVHSKPLPEFEIPKTSDSSTQTETIVNGSPMEEDNKISPSPLRMSLESSFTDNEQQTDVQVKLPDLNITCQPHATDPPCDLAQNDVYRNFFTVMLNEMRRVGKENCSQNCTGTKIVPACEQCIKNLINRKINDRSMDEEVTDFAAIHCPQQDETDNTKNIDSSGQSSSAPYARCKYKFIADLTSLFGLWLKAITNSR